MIFRRFKPGDDQTVLDLVNKAYRNLETLTAERLKGLLSPPYFDPRGFFIADEHGEPVGCLGAFNLGAKGYVELRYLAAKDAFSRVSVVDRLIESGLKYAASKQCKRVKAVALMIQPYVKEYRRFGFNPVRRILRIAWDHVRPPGKERVNNRVTVTPVSENEANEACRVFVEGLQPHWDWWVEEKGGNEALLKEAVESMRMATWISARVNDKIVGVTNVTPRLERGEASFSGVIVLPKWRMQGVGSVLMNAALNRTIGLGFSRLVVHTLSYLDALAPAAVLYLKSGGKIEAEYLHLVKES